MISEAGLAGSSARILPAGTVAFTRDATVGLAAILGQDMAVSQHLVGWVCGPELDPRFLLYVIYAMQHELNRLTWGATIKTIGMPDLRNLSCPLPPFDEQQQIIQKLEAALGSVKRLKLNLTTSIDLLNEYRSAIITTAVTGRIDLITWGKHGGSDRRLEAIEQDLEVERDEAAV
jgi:type I restriction enzyme, S subunit